MGNVISYNYGNPVLLYKFYLLPSLFLMVLKLFYITVLKCFHYLDISQNLSDIFCNHFQIFNSINKGDISNNIQFCVNVLLIHLNESQVVGLGGKITPWFPMDRWTDFQRIFSLVMNENSFCLCALDSIYSWVLSFQFICDAMIFYQLKIPC